MQKIIEKKQQKERKRKKKIITRDRITSDVH